MIEKFALTQCNAFSWSEGVVFYVTPILFGLAWPGLGAPCEGAMTLWVKVPPGQWSVGPVAGRRPGRVTVPVEALR